MPKRIGSSLYAHRSALEDLPGDRLGQVRQAEPSLDPSFNWNLVRSDRDRVVFMETTSFSADPHPKLLRSVGVQLDSLEVSSDRSYGPNSYPIYHRKETMLSADHLRRGSFESLTQQEEAAGLLGRSDIGYSRAWEAILASRGLRIRHHTLRCVVDRGALSKLLDTLYGAIHEGKIPEHERDDYDEALAVLCDHLEERRAFGALREGEARAQGESELDATVAATSIVGVERGLGASCPELRLLLGHLG